VRVCCKRLLSLGWRRQKERRRRRRKASRAAPDARTAHLFFFGTRLLNTHFSFYDGSS
jgi:hypothetical protein